MPILPSLMLRTDQCIAAKYDGRLRWFFVWNACRFALKMHGTPIAKSSIERSDLRNTSCRCRLGFRAPES